MTDAELSALESAARAATPGPWEDLSNHPDHLRGAVNKGEKHIALCGYLDTWEEERRVTLKEMLANAAYIAAANPAAVLSLIAKLRQTRAERDWIARKYTDAFNALGRPDRMTVAKVLTIAKEAICQKN